MPESLKSAKTAAAVTVAASLFLRFADLRPAARVATRQAGGGKACLVIFQSGYFRAAFYPSERALPPVVYRALVATTLCVFSLVANCGAQYSFAPWEPPNAYVQPQPRGLDSLSDEELLDLYIATYQESLRSQVRDDASLAQRGRLLFQVGYTYSFDRDDLGFRTVEHTIPELLMRYRLLKCLELRFAWAGVTFDKMTDELTGLSDWDVGCANPSFGARLALSSQNGWLPRMSLTASTPFDVKSRTALANRLAPLISVGYSWLLGDQWLLSGSSGAIWAKEDDSRFLDFHQSVSLDWMGGDQWDVYIEWSGLFPEGARFDGMSHSCGPGYSYRITRDVQFDLFASFGLDALSPDLMLQFLGTWRF